jgi:hypothetical protein
MDIRLEYIIFIKKKQNTEKEEQKKFVTPILTKKRYANISEKVSAILEGGIEETALVLKALCEETKFDPELKKYTVKGKK